MYHEYLRHIGLVSSENQFRYDLINFRRLSRLLSIFCCKSRFRLSDLGGLSGLLAENERQIHSEHRAFPTVECQRRLQRFRNVSLLASYRMALQAIHSMGRHSVTSQITGETDSSRRLGVIATRVASALFLAGGKSMHSAV